MDDEYLIRSQNYYCYYYYYSNEVSEFPSRIVKKVIVKFNRHFALLQM